MKQNHNINFKEGLSVVFVLPPPPTIPCVYSTDYIVLRHNEFPRRRLRPDSNVETTQHAERTPSLLRFDSVAACQSHSYVHLTFPHGALSSNFICLFIYYSCMNQQMHINEAVQLHMFFFSFMLCIYMFRSLL